MPKTRPLPDSSSTLAVIGRKIAGKARSISGTFYFVPALFIIGAIVISQLGLWLDRNVIYGSEITLFGWLNEVGVDGSRAMLSAIGTAMLGVAATAFSITISVIATASSNYGPRLVHNFMSDRGNQIVLGVLCSTFIYALLVLRTIRSGADEVTSFVPHLSVTIAVIFALADVALLIWFIHHIADSVQVSTLVEEVRQRWREVVDRTFPEPVEPVDQDNDNITLAQAPVPFRNSAARLSLARDGFITEVAFDAIADICHAHDLRVSVEKRVGDHVVQDEPVALIWPASALEERERQLRQCFTVDDSRTTYQDVRFAQQSVIELAVRALSPGTNDPYTAINAIQELGAGVVLAVSRHRLGEVMVREGEPRVWTIPPSIDDIVATSFDHIRPYCANALPVQQALIDLGRRVQAATIHPHLRDLVEEKFDQLRAQAEAAGAAPADLAGFDRYRMATQREGWESWQAAAEIGAEAAAGE